MNEIKDAMRQTYGLQPERTLHRIVHKTGHIVTEGQIETAGKTYTKATVTIAALHAMIDAARLVGRTLWKLTTLAAIGLAGTWTYLHWSQILHWLR